MVPGLICLLAFALITTWSGYVVGTFKLQHREVYSLDDAGAIMLGLPGRAVLAASFCLYYIFNSGSAILGLSVGINAVSSHAPCTASFVAVAAIVGFACSSIRTLGKITWLAWIGLPCILTAVLIVTIAVGVEDRPAGAPAATTGRWASDWKTFGHPSFSDGIAAVSNLLFAFSGTPGFFSIVSEMRDPQHYVASPALGSAGGAIKIISYAFALPGLMVTMTIVTHIPAKFIFVHALRGSRHLTTSTPTHWISWLGCTFGLTLVAWIIASTIPIFDALVSLIGALLGPLICIVPMAAMWLHDNWGRGTEGQSRSIRWMLGVMWTVALIILGAFLIVGGTYGSVKMIMSSYHDDGGSAAFSCADNSSSS